MKTVGFGRRRRGCAARRFVEDLVSRKWITTVVSSQETHTQVQLAFEQALDAEDLLEPALAT